MQIKKIVSVALMVILFCHKAFADTPEQTLTSLLLNISTLKANFTQSVKDKTARALQQTQGRMALQRPGKLRWEVIKPTPQLIIANGNKLWIYDRDLEQVTIRNFSKTTGQAPALLLSDKNLTLGRDYNVTSLPVTAQIAGLQIYQLIPKNKEDIFDNIKLSFIGHAIHQMQLQDRLGHVTTITFQNVATGMSLPGNLFQFTPPANVDVIDETKNKRR